jgi:DNA polymerase-3 subunit delta
VGYNNAMIFFFYGPNSYAARRKLGDLRDAYIKKTGTDFGLERIDGAVATAEQLNASLLAAPFLATSRLVIVERLGTNKTTNEKIEPILAQIPDTTVAVFYDPEVDQRTSYFKTMMKLAKPAKFAMLAVPQLVGWTKREVEAQGGKIDRAAIAKLVDMVGDDQWRLSAEINKLVNYAPEVTSENVELLVTKSPTDTIFDLVEQMSGGQLGKALATFRTLIAERTSEIYILTMVTWQLRNLLLAKSAGTSSSGELAKRAGLSPYVATKAIARQRDFSEEGLKKAYLAAVETDYAIKSGQGVPEHLVEQLIYQVAAAKA